MIVYLSVIYLFWCMWCRCSVIHVASWFVFGALVECKLTIVLVNIFGQKHNFDCVIVTSQAKTFRTLSRFYTDSRSLAVHQPFERTGMPFERLELTVLKNSSSVRTVRAMRSTKLISRSNGSSYPFEKIHQPFERLELSVRENSSAVWTARAIRSRKFISRSNGSSYPFKKETVSYFDDFKTINSPFFVKWCMPSCLHYTNSRHASVLCLPPLKWYSLHFLRKNVWFTSSY